MPVPRLFMLVLPVIFWAKVELPAWLKFTVAVPLPPVISEALRVPAVVLPPRAPRFNVPTPVPAPTSNPRITLPVPPPTLTVPLPTTLSVPVPSLPTVISEVLVKLPAVTVKAPTAGVVPEVE